MEEPTGRPVHNCRFSAGTEAEPRGAELINTDQPQPRRLARRLATTGYLWAFAALTASTGARAHYDRRRAAGDRHAAAQRNLFNRMLGCLHHCLQHRRTTPEHLLPTHWSLTVR